MAQFPKAIWVKAVEQKCAECIYDPGSLGGSWREQVSACSDASCPLYPVRPLPAGQKHESDAVIFNLGARRRQELRQCDE